MTAINEIRWLPLESNPEVMNKYLRQLDVKEEWSFFDVFSFDEETLGSIPRPVIAVLLLYPLSEQSLSNMIGKEVEVPEVYFVKQTVENACGTIGLIHALLNNTDKLCLDENHLTKFWKDTLNRTPQERSILFESDVLFGNVHEEVSRQGQSRVPSRNEKLEHHFLTFIHHRGILYELVLVKWFTDGRKNGPVKHGPTTEDTLLENSVDVVKKFMERDPLNLNFTVVALAKAQIV